MWKIQRSLVSEILPLDDESVILFGLVIKVHFVSIGCLNIASEVQLNITTLIKAGVEVKTGWWDGEMRGWGRKRLRDWIFKKLHWLNCKSNGKQLTVFFWIIYLLTSHLHFLSHYLFPLMTGYKLIPVD